MFVCMYVYRYIFMDIHRVWLAVFWMCTKFYFCRVLLHRHMSLKDSGRLLIVGALYVEYLIYLTNVCVTLLSHVYKSDHVPPSYQWAHQRCYKHTQPHTHPNAQTHTARRSQGERRMGWLRLVGSLKLQVFFVEHRLFYRALLKKRPTILRSLLVEATP